MNQIWYLVRTAGCFDKVEEVVVVRQTKKFVTYMGKDCQPYRSQKITDYDAIFPTIQEAVDWKINILKESILRYALRLEDPGESLKNFMKYVETKYPQVKIKEN